MADELASFCGDGTVPPTIDMYPNMFDQDAVGLLFLPLSRVPLSSQRCACVSIE